MKTTITYHLITSLLGNDANSQTTESFNTVEEAIDYWEKNLKNRDKKDGYDEYWQKIPLRIQQIIKTDFWGVDGITATTVEEKKGFSIIKWFENFLIN
jgi:hypothetical protein